MAGGDGAHMGVSADRALETILQGAPQPSESEQRTPAEMRVYLLGAFPEPWDYEGDGYGQCARWCGRLILEQYEAWPELVALPMDNSYLRRTDGDGRFVDFQRDDEGKPIVLVRGLSDTLRDLGVRFPAGITGFQWGWAVNAARYAVDADQQPNPAIMEIG